MGRHVDPGKHCAWSERIRRRRESGLTVAEFCEWEGVSVGSFYNWQKKLRGTKSRRKSVELVTPEGSSPRSRQPASKKSNIGRIASALACKGASIMRIISTMRTNCATLLAAQHGSDLHRQLDRIGQMLSVHCEVQIEAFANGRDLSRVLMRLRQNLQVILQPTLCVQRHAGCSC